MCRARIGCGLLGFMFVVLMNVVGGRCDDDVDGGGGDG